MIHRLTLALLFCIAATTFPHAYAAHDVDWLTASVSGSDLGLSESGAVRARQAAQAYLKAAAPLDKKPFDVSYAVGLLHDGFTDTDPFTLLDQAMRRESELEKGHGNLRKASNKEIPPDHFVRRQSEKDYNFLKSRLRFIIAIARASVSQQMAVPSSASYCWQAMESAIDALRDSAAFGEKAAGRSPSLGEANPEPEKIRDLRTRLLDIWDRSQKDGDLSPIAGMNLRTLVDETLAKTAHSGRK